MYQTIIKEKTYKDSIVLMLLTNEISTVEGVNKVSIMMATDANKSIFEGSGMLTEEVKAASPNDIAIVIDVDSQEVLEHALEKIDEFLNESKSTSSGSEVETARTWDQALKAQEDANVAVISVPGTYAAMEAHNALDKGLNVFMFSDNVSKEDEVELKQRALKENLMVMGPDCGTGIIKNIPIAFTNSVARGNIGIVGASGTGIQEITSLIHKAGHGVTSALGTGGRDLHSEIGGITMLQSIKALKEDPETKVILVLSKPSAPEIREKINQYLLTIDKPIVTLFVGEKPEAHSPNIYRAHTLAEAARAAIMFDLGKNPIEELKAFNVSVPATQAGKNIKAYYSGGTLASEASMLISDALEMDKIVSSNLFTEDGYVVVDLGEDEFTQGKPHPMIDPEVRVAYMKEALKDENTGVVLFDVVLGYGSHPDMASALAPSIVEISEANPNIEFVATVCGTDRDKQDITRQIEILENLGVTVCESNEEAVLTSLAKIGKPLTLTSVPMEADVKEVAFDDSVYATTLLSEDLKIINVGLESFNDNIIDAKGDSIHFEWQPIAGGNLELIKALSFLNHAEDIKEEA